MNDLDPSINAGSAKVSHVVCTCMLVDSAIKLAWVSRISIAFLSIMTTKSLLHESFIALVQTEYFSRELIKRS